MSETQTVQILNGFVMPQFLQAWIDLHERVILTPEASVSAPFQGCPICPVNGLGGLGQEEWRLHSHLIDIVNHHTGWESCYCINAEWIRTRLIQEQAAYVVFMRTGLNRRVLNNLKRELDAL